MNSTNNTKYISVYRFRRGIGAVGCYCLACLACWFVFILFRITRHCTMPRLLLCVQVQMMLAILILQKWRAKQQRASQQKRRDKNCLILENIIFFSVEREETFFFFFDFFLASTTYAHLNDFSCFWADWVNLFGCWAKLPKNLRMPMERYNGSFGNYETVCEAARFECASWEPRSSPNLVHSTWWLNTTQIDHWSTRVK